MAFDAFLQIDGIPGESTDDKHSEWIELLKFNYSADQPSSGSVSSGGGRSAERVDLDDLHVTKAIDKATPKLLLNCCNGRHIAKITLEVCRSGEDKQLYYKIVMEDVIVTSIQAAGMAKGQGSAPLPIEEVSFGFGKITWTYTETDHKTGQPKGDVETFWDLHSNKGG